MHQNWSTGEPCNCTFTTHLGKTASVKIADKLHDFLMNPESRPDLKTPEGQAWLRLLDHHYQHIGEKFDPLTPWLTREWKKGRLLHEYNPDFGQREPNHVGHMYYKSPDPHFEGYQRAPLNQTDLGHWSDFMQANHPIRRQLGDIMQHDVGSFHGRVNDWSKAMEAEAQQQALEGGEVVHQTPDDWTVRRLRTPEELSAEGNAMGHCVGGYHSAVQSGNTQIYSLRDPNNTPHSTIEIKPRVTAHGPWNGPNQGEVIQIQGKANQEAHDEYKARLADWFRTFPDEQRPHWDESPDDKPLWDDNGYSHHELDHPDLIPQYEEENGGLQKRTEPTEDAYGLLRYPHPMEADYDSLLDNIRFNSYGYYDTPEQDHIDNIYRLAKERGEIPALAKAAESYEQEQNDKFYEWLDMNYEYSPRYVEESEPHGWVDEEGEDVGEGEGQPYWEPEGAQGERYFDPAQAEKAYDDAIQSWTEQHPGLQAGNRLYQYINQHATGPNPETGYIEYQNELKPEAVDAMLRGQAKTASSLHKNPWGDPCRCAWFKPIEKEHVGAVKEAAKLDWLRERPDVQKDLRKHWIVNHIFPQYPEGSDPLLPWLMREYSKGNLRLHNNVAWMIDSLEEAQQEHDNFIQAGFDPNSHKGRELKDRVDAIEQGTQNVIDQNYGLVGDTERHGTTTPQSWTGGLAQMMDSLKKRGQGIDVMQHNFAQMLNKHEDWKQAEEERELEERKRNNGQVVHHVEHPEYPGWTVRRLRDKDECDLEGELMGHCVGSYGLEAEHGHTNIFSLRDPKNQPHATMEVHGPSGSNPEDPTEWKIPEHAWDELPMKEFQGVPIEDIRNLHDYGGYNYHEHSAQGVYPEFMRRAKEHGTAMPPLEGGQVDATQGRSNDNPLPEYTDMLNEFLGKHGLQSQGNKWWDDWYEMDGPQDIRELVGANGSQGQDLGFHGYPEDAWHEAKPEDYLTAESDALDRGMEPPELYVGDPNYKKILESLVDPPTEYVWDPNTGNSNWKKPWQGYNPQAGDYLLNHAQEQGQHDRLGNALYDIAVNEGAYSLEPFQPSPELLAIPDYWQRHRALQDAERAHQEEQGINSPYLQMYNHLGPQLGMQPVGQQYSYQTIHQIDPEQEQLWGEHGSPYHVPGYEAVRPMPGQPNVFSKVAHPLYMRWVFSPASGEVHLEDNSSDPLETKYHTDLARELNEPNLVHGYAYRIGDGWRLTDWDSRPVEDHFVIAQVMRALQSQKPNGADSWEPDYDDDWSRIHLGLPS